jgi:hypothetical protein
MCGQAPTDGILDKQQTPYNPLAYAKLGSLETKVLVFRTQAKLPSVLQGTKTGTRHSNGAALRKEEDNRC